MPNERMAEVVPYLDDIGDTEVAFLRLVERNEHNTWPQIRDAGDYTDGTITINDSVNEYEMMTDPDDDGLITAIEWDIGTDENNPDTDDGGLGDGPEWAGGYMNTKSDVYVPLNNSDPLHTDIHLTILPIDGDITPKPRDDTPEDDPALLNRSETYAEMKERFAGANVTNPDGEQGIALHLYRQTEDIRKYRGAKKLIHSSSMDMPKKDGWNEIYHPYWGLHHFAKLEDTGLDPRAPVRFTTLWVFPYPERSEGALVYTPHLLVQHELLHNIGVLELHTFDNQLITNDQVGALIDQRGIDSLDGPRELDRHVGWEMPPTLPEGEETAG